MQMMPEIKKSVSLNMLETQKGNYVNAGEGMWDPLKSNFNWSQIMLEIKKSLSLNMLERREHCNRNWRNFATLVKILMSLVIFRELAFFGLG